MALSRETHRAPSRTVETAPRSASQGPNSSSETPLAICDYKPAVSGKTALRTRREEAGMTTHRLGDSQGNFEEHRRRYEHLHGAFGADRFGQVSEKAARFFGTPQYIVGQTVVVVVWIALNSLAISLEWDPYPFILLNLAFSTQAAYAAPFILLAQTRQADRDKAHQEAATQHRDELAATELHLLEENTALTKQVSELTKELERLTRGIHDRLVEGGSV